MICFENLKIIYAVAHYSSYIVVVKRHFYV